VTEGAHAFVAQTAASAGQRALLETALLELRAARAQESWTSPVHLPLLVHGALTGDDEPAVPLAVALSLLQLGIDLLDHIADGEVDPCWSGRSEAAVHLAAVGFLSAVGPRAVAELPVSATLRAELQRGLCVALFEVGAGQQRDLELASGGPPSLEAVRAAVAGKTGACRAWFARLAALLAGSSPERVESCARLGFHLGMALQWRSDVEDSLSPESRDLAAGTPTLPVALWLARRSGADRDAGWALVRRARSDAEARAHVQREILGSGVVRWCCLSIDAERARARAALDDMEAREPWRRWMHAWIDAAGQPSSDLRA
jgi:heptaprenyl diphosphate synthase